MGKGWSYVRNNETLKACDVWLTFWDKLKSRFKPEFKDIRQADTVFSGREPIFNWCQDLEMELGNAGLDDPTYYQKRIEYCNEICTIFPESDESIIHNMKRAVAESYFALGSIDEGTICFKKLIEQYPNNVWSYIGWGDMYLWPLKKNYDPDYERAEQIYKMALDMNIDGKKDLIDRLNEVEKKRAQNA
jgi:tetratricopeptide (TPR) repeat protein